MNQLSHEQQLTVLRMLVEGNSLRSITRMTGIHRTTVMKLMVRIGAKCRDFLDRWMRNLTLNHLELDEIWTFVLKKQRRIPASQAGNKRIGDQYLFVALDLETKLIPCFAIGKRNANVTDLFMQDLADRLVLPELHQVGPKPQLSTDGFAAYPDAIDEAFAARADYGQIIKDFGSSGEQTGRYAPPDLLATIRRVITGNINKNSICTSHVERHNLSIRTFLRRFTRLALGFSKKLENLVACTSIYICYYNFCWLHGSLPGTPAMAAKIAGHPWTLAELLNRLED